MVGLISIGGRYIGLANAAYFISDPVLLGFKTGAALYIASTQLPKLFGVEGATGNFFERIGHVIGSLPEAHLPSLLFGLGAIALFIVFQRSFPGRPTTLVVVVAAVALMSVFHLAATGIKVVGELPLGLPEIGFPEIHFADISELVPVALACFLLAYGEAISVARSFAQKHGYDINPQQELTALGAANIATGMTHGFPVAGGMSQTAVNDMGGASSPAALIVTSVAIALTLIFFAQFFHNLPEPVLGAIVLMAASHLIRIEDLRQLRNTSRTEFIIALLGMIGVLFLGLLQGLLLAVAGALVMLVAHASRPPVVFLGRDPSTGRFVSQARYPETDDTPGALVIRSAGAWVYFNAEHTRRRIIDMIEEAPTETRTVVLDFSIVPRIDITAATILIGLARSLSQRGVALKIAELRDDVAEQLRASGVEQDLGRIVAHRSIEDCLAESIISFNFDRRS
jgi:MFS superfamily sulfate permease-like transporter